MMTFETFSRYALYIHPDISLTPVQGGEKELLRLLAESGAAERIDIDEDEGKSRSCIVTFQVFTLDSWGTPQHSGSWITRTGLVEFRHWCEWS